MSTVHFFYVAATKLIVLKIIYGFLFYALAVKAWHFMLWFVHYIKKSKSHEHFIEFEHERWIATDTMATSMGTTIIRLTGSISQDMTRSTTLIRKRFMTLTVPTL
ncbi:unnamed protein product [Danaus chrysippus]|uniref:(African queen) hypothetical protein n=1 Tax=Danaus chrysippus TaxID=151541 RepID=A0A8J2RHH0_9NEOP|nr:unnamed protein product [Danaus chrysippus]